ncbi:hypothetical protein DN051_01735 [Streptomyces cadmiisoli]|uniref:Uncharacterized protein n=1 Tax=Streptomyces cadmiisoli TaxID=2184053 RepID=A0A2Z4ISA0_9ACTN|nr:hypothetical protein DN051_01735 [Streptomyces cadmiisoli]
MHFDGHADTKVIDGYVPEVRDQAEPWRTGEVDHRDHVRQLAADLRNDRMPHNGVAEDSALP